MNSRERFINACHCRPVDRPPVWLMRQAGRYLPEYRALKEQHDFLELVRTPELAARVTVQPLERYPLDAAILFSDILVIPEALGQPYFFREAGGIGMEYRVDSKEAIADLDATAMASKLSYVADALRLVRRRIGDEVALLGFGGAPWTLATYMVEGGSSTHFKNAKRLFMEQRDDFDRLLSKITEALIQFFQLQIEAGIDAVQIFDSWAGACMGSHYEAMSLRWVGSIIDALPEGFPVILFARGMAHHLPSLLSTGAHILSVDASVDLADLRRNTNDDIALQGNLDPAILVTTPDIVARETRRLLDSMRGSLGHILNLGHGITPDSKIENVEALVETAVAWS